MLDVGTTQYDVTDDSVAAWQERIRLGLKYRTTYGFSDRWTKYRNYYRNEYGMDLTYNMIYAVGRTLIPSICYRNPYAVVSPNRPQFTPHSRIIESILNWLIQELQIKKQARRIAKDAYLCGRGFGKIGYDNPFGFAERLLDDEDSTLTQYTSKRSGYRLSYNVASQPGMPWYLRVQPETIVVPFGSFDADDISWFAHLVFRPTADVKEDKLYKNASDLSSSHILLPDGYQSHSTSLMQEMARVTNIIGLWEIHDYRRGEVKTMVMDESHKKWLRHDEDVLQVDGLPITTFTMDEDSEHFWATPLVRQFEGQQMESNETRMQTRAHRWVAVLKFLYDKNKISKQELDKIMTGQVMPGIACDGSVAGSYALIQPQIPNDLAMWPEHLRKDVRELVGIGVSQAGATTEKTHQLKAEQDYAYLGHELSVGDKRVMLGEMLSRALRKILQICLTRWSVPRVLPVIGQEGINYWVELAESLRGELLRAECTVSIDVASMAPPQTGERKREIGQLLSIVAKLPGAPGVQYLLSQLIKEFQWADLTQILPSRPGTMGANQFMSSQSPGASQSSSSMRGMGGGMGGGMR